MKAPAPPANGPAAEVVIEGYDDEIAVDGVVHNHDVVVVCQSGVTRPYDGVPRPVSSSATGSTMFWSVKNPRRRGTYGALSLVLGMARTHGLAHPVEGVRLPRVERGELLIPTPEQVEALAAAIDPRMWAMVRLAAYCGLRQGECLALWPENIDWLGRRIRVEATLNLRNQRRESPKGGRGRWVTMPSIVADSLSAHLKAHPASEYVFHRASGRPWKASRVWEAWNDARTACKLGDVDFHHLRHHAASLMIAAGWSVPRVSAELGHRDPAMTLRVYAHLWPSELDQGRNQLDAAIARLAGPRADHGLQVVGD